ncbi:MAG: hypothetical protein RMY28_002075 [Nostoc sp. ChiSLP01]|nr:hypothetical protein [Nostoc sp. CmiSLP01]MDZ8286580.1 hypothetical protein [Nostoc sp. ChiSLP01]
MPQATAFSTRGFRQRAASRREERQGKSLREFGAASQRNGIKSEKRLALVTDACRLSDR